MTAHNYANPDSRTWPLLGGIFEKFAELFHKSGQKSNLQNMELTQYAMESALHTTALAENIEPLELQIRLEQIFRDAHEEIFQDGMESDFSRALVAFLARYSVFGTDALITFLDGTDADPEAVAEALKWIAEFDNPSTLPKRLWLLERSLNSSFASIRDGAVIGLGSLDDPQAIHYVKQALGRETKPLLRRNIQLLIDQLNETALERGPR